MHLCKIYRGSANSEMIETLEIKGVDHTILPERLSAQERFRYLNGLFGNIGSSETAVNLESFKR